MSQLHIAESTGSGLSAPASGVLSIYADSVGKMLATKDSTGFVRTLGRTNFSTAAQAPAAATRTYLTGSQIAVPSTKLQIGSLFEWEFSLTKTAAGSASSTLDVAIGTAGTTADTARLSFTKPAGTAAADEAWFRVIALCRGPLSGAGVMVGAMTMIHNLASTGHATIPCVVVTAVSAAFDVTVANLFLGLCLTSGASDAVTIQLMRARATDL